jgi:pimeloyl-ACP methyl ester carboxylesterase
LAPAGFWNNAERRYAVAILLTHRALGYLPKWLITPFLSTPRMRRISCSMIYGRPESLDPIVPYDDLRSLREGPAFTQVARAHRHYHFSGQPAVPVTVAWGTKDRILPVRQAERAKVRLPEARHVLLPGCGHAMMNDDPDLVAGIILETTRAR